MPILPPATPNSTITNQVLPNSGVTPYVQQMNMGQMIGQVVQYNPDAQAQAPIWINSSLRKVLARRTWFGQWVKGQLICPQATTQGTATVTLNSNLVQGTNTAWTAALVGQQFRIGYNNPIYTIVAVDPVGQVLQLELPWGGPSSSSGYFIVQYYYILGPNIKYLKIMVNMQLGYKFQTHWTQDGLDSIDPWRQNQNWPWAVAPMPLDPNGNYLVELYPASWIQQAFPFKVYVQPPNLVNDADSLPAYIRADVVLLDAIAQALTWKGPKKNPYYDAAEANRMRVEFAGELNHMANEDENLYRTNVSMPGEDLPYYTAGGSLWTAQHAVMAGEGGFFGDL